MQIILVTNQIPSSHHDHPHTPHQALIATLHPWLRRRYLFMQHRFPSADPDLDQFADLPNGIRICFRSYGQDHHPAVVLVAGLGLQQVSWPLDLIDGLAAAGLRVITLDNRDIGRSTHLHHQLPPPRWRLLCGVLPTGHYRLDDMAQDVALLLGHLHVPLAHVVGMSMGGMIAQLISIQFPERVLSLTSMMATLSHSRPLELCRVVSTTTVGSNFNSPLALNRSRRRTK